MLENKKNAFTLIELLAVLVILAVILVIAIPKVISLITDVRKGVLESTAKLVAIYAEKNKMENDVFDIESVLTCENVVKINDVDYETCRIKYVDGVFKVSIVGKGKFEGMYICNGTKSNSKVTDHCINEDVLVEFELNGGSLENKISGIYVEGSLIQLPVPTKDNSTFLGWEVVKGNSVLENDILTVGNKDTIIYALWENWSSLDINLNGGSISQNLNHAYKSGTSFVLEEPIKTGYTFSGWKIESGDSILSGNNFTMGSSDTSIVANYKANKYFIEYELNGGKFETNPPDSAEYDDVIEIKNPKKIGYKFVGWTFNGLNTKGSKYGDSLSDVSISITDNKQVVLGEYFISLNASSNGKVVMTANWEFVPNQVVYEHCDSYVFDGTNYIDTGISLFSEEYFDINFEVSFSILNIENDQEMYGTLFNGVNEVDENYPGVLFRVSNSK